MSAEARSPVGPPDVDDPGTGAVHAISRRQIVLGAGAVTALAILGGAHLSHHPAHHAASDDPASDLITRSRFGAYAANEPYSEQAHFDLEDVVGRRLPVASWFVAWGSPWPTESSKALQDKGDYDILLCWEAHGVNFDDVLAGRYDQQITDMVNGAATHRGGRVVIRFFHESNGNWYDWTVGSGRGFCSGSAQWIEAWRHVVRIGRAANPQVKYMFCMNGSDSGGPSAESLYPGSDAVDIIGCDAYAWGGISGGSFDAIHREMYGRLTKLHATADYWVGETGLDNQSGSADWYTGAYTSHGFPRLTTVCWFNTDAFRFTTDPGALDVHRAQLPRMA